MQEPDAEVSGRGARQAMLDFALHEPTTERLCWVKPGSREDCAKVRSRCQCGNPAKISLVPSREISNSPFVPDLVVWFAG
jgi:hypothetical protein